MTVLEDMPADPCAVYRLFDASDALLYVGISDKPRARVATHLSEKSWSAEVARTSVTWHANRGEAKAEESRAILGEAPRYNIMETPLHNGRGTLSYAPKEYPAVREVLDRLRSIADPVKRAEAALEVRQVILAGTEETGHIRREAILELTEKDLTQAEIGRLLGVSRSRIKQVVDGQTRSGARRKKADG